MADRFAFNTRCLPELANHPRLGEVLGQMAGQVAEEARATAPVDEGDYVASIDSTVVHDEGMLKGVVYSDDFKALYIEFGTVDTPPFATLRRALDTLAGGFDLTNREVRGL